MSSFRNPCVTAIVFLSAIVSGCGDGNNEHSHVSTLDDSGDVEQDGSLSDTGKIISPDTWPPPKKVFDRIDLKSSAVEDSTSLEPTNLDSIATLGFGVRAAVFSPTGNVLYCVGSSGLSKLTTDNYDKDNAETWESDGQGFEDISISSNGRTLLTATSDDVIWTWDTTSGKSMYRKLHQKSQDHMFGDPLIVDVEPLVCSPDGTVAITSDINHFSYLAWNTKNGSALWQRRSEWRDILPIAFSGSTDVLLRDASHSLSLCRITTAQPLAQLPIDLSNSISQVVISNDGGNWVLANHDPTYVGVIDSSTGLLRWSRQIDSDSILGLSLDEESKLLLLCIRRPDGKSILGSTYLDVRHVGTGEPVALLHIKHGGSSFNYSEPLKQFVLDNRVYELPDEIIPD